MELSGQRLLVGLMCGTSGDGVSGALVETEGLGRDRQLRVLAHEIMPYPREIRDRLFAMFLPNRFSASDFAHLHRDLGELLAEAALRIIEIGEHRPRELTAIAVHAPTVFHEPPELDHEGVHVEIGEAAIIAERTGVTVLCDLRPNDIAAGGQGAPLSAFVDWALFTDDQLCRAVQNIGGIANVTFLPPGSDLRDVLSFDTGPGNMVIDGVVHTLTRGRDEFDRDGERAAQGSIDKPLLAELLAHPYVARRPPKTTGREDFGQQFAEELVQRARELGVGENDLVATATAFTVECIRVHYDRELRTRAQVDEMILYGGGAHNPTLVRMLRERIAPTKVRLHDEFGIPGDAREAATWAVLADESLAGRSANVPAASGAHHPVILGKVVRTRVEHQP
jgi:anhydro-N-acetylmuramic acid kinase